MPINENLNEDKIEEDTIAEGFRGSVNAKASRYRKFQTGSLVLYTLSQIVIATENIPLETRTALRDVLQERAYEENE